MKILKYVSLFVFMLGSASCWGMSFDDMDINHESDAVGIGTGDIGHHIALSYKDTQIGYLDWALLRDQKKSSALDKFLASYAWSNKMQDLPKEVRGIFAGKELAIIEQLRIEDKYQKNGFGYQFLDYVLDHIKNNHRDSVIFLRPVQSFAKKDDVNLSYDQLQEKLVNFYKRFGAVHVSGMPEWMYIPLKK